MAYLIIQPQINTFCVICVSEVTDISPGNLDSSLCFIQCSISHDVCNICILIGGLPQWLKDKEAACNAGDTGDEGSIPGLEKSPGERKGYPLQYPGLENSMECKVHGVAKRHNQMTCTYTFFF